MWLMLDTGFISVVRHREDTAMLQVRARIKEDLIAAVGVDAAVVEIEGADYQFRADITADAFAEIIAEKIRQIDYESHVKDVAIARSHPVDGRSKAYYSIWSALADIQPNAPYWVPNRPSAGSMAAAGIPARTAWGAFEQRDEEPKAYLDDLRVCRVSMPNAWDQCDDCGHNALLHPGQNDIDCCILCEIEERCL